jgi:hypothetical protein
MVTTIVPSVFVGRKESWTMVAGLFLVGGVLGGAASGLFLGTIGATFYKLLPVAVGTAPFTVMVGTFGYAFHALGFIRLPTLSLRRQVPRQLQNQYSLILVALIYSLQLGAGVLTRIPTVCVYVLCLAIIAIGSPIAGAILMGLYGLMRSSLTIALSADLHSMEAAITRSLSLAAWYPVAQTLGVLSLVVLGVICGTQVVRAIW